MPKAKIVTDLKNNYFTNNKITFGTAQPTSGSYVAGDIVISKTPTSTAYGWVCTSSGTPGSWKVLKSASDLPSVSWGNVSGKPATFPAITGTTSTTATRGDIGNHAYTHSQSAHAPANAQRNADITKAEIEAKLTGLVNTHTHNYAPINHGNHIPSKETADNTRFLCSDGKWKNVFPNFISGIAHFTLPDHLSGAPESYVKLCTLTITKDQESHCEILLSGNGDYGQVGHSFGILRASGRGNCSVSYMQLMKSDTSQIEIGYVKSSTTMDVWMKRPAFDGIGAMTILGISPVNCKIYSKQEITQNKPSGYQAVTSDDLFNNIKTNMCIGNNNTFRGGTTNLNQFHFAGVDAGNNIFLGLDNQAYINVNNTMKFYKDLVAQAALHLPGMRIDKDGFGTIMFGSGNARLEYVKNEGCIQFAGDDNELYGYRLPFRAKTFQNVNAYCLFGSHCFSFGPDSDPSGRASVWFRN